MRKVRNFVEDCKVADSYMLLAFCFWGNKKIEFMSTERLLLTGYGFFLFMVSPTTING